MLKITFALKDSPHLEHHLLPLYIWEKPEKNCPFNEVKSILSHFRLKYLQKKNIKWNNKPVWPVFKMYLMACLSSNFVYLNSSRCSSTSASLVSMSMGDWRLPSHSEWGMLAHSAGLNSDSGENKTKFKTTSCNSIITLKPYQICTCKSLRTHTTVIIIAPWRT